MAVYLLLKIGEYAFINIEKPLKFIKDKDNTLLFRKPEKLFEKFIPRRGTKEIEPKLLVETCCNFEPDFFVIQLGNKQVAEVTFIFEKFSVKIAQTN